MKKLLSLCLVAVLAFSVLPTAQAFKDISDPLAQIAAEGLSSIGIVSTVDQFYPDKNLSRAEFCKMAVLSAGFDEESSFSSQVYFPDVMVGNWYTSYVNAAVKKYAIIVGYPNGYFGANDDVTYGQAVTMLLELLGYKRGEVGAFWPRDHIMKAEQIGLTKGVSGIGDNQPLPRKYAAIIINNMMNINTKEGAPYINTGFSAKSGAVLLSTSATDSSLKSGQAKLFIDSKETVYDIASMPVQLVGLMGTAVFNKQNPTQLEGFLSDTSNATVVTVKSTASDGITSESGTVYIPSEVTTSVMGYVAEYATCWFDIKAGNTVMIYRDSRGTVTGVSVIGATASSNAVIYGIDDVSLNANATFMHNGATITKDKLKTYDVLSYMESTNTYTVSDNRLILRYENSGPTYNNPTYIEAGGIRFNLSAKASPYFKDIKFGQTVTLLLDYAGNIAAAYPNLNTSNMAPRGILTKLSDTEAEIKLDNGFTVKGKPSRGETISVGGQQVSALYQSVGRLVTVYQASDGNLQIRPVSMQKSGMPMKEYLELDSDLVADNVKIYEQMGSVFPVYLVENHKVDQIKINDIAHVERNRAGKISLIISADITGEHYAYGMVSQTQSQEEKPGLGAGDVIVETTYTLKLENKDGLKTFETRFNPGMSYSTVPAAIAKDAFDGKYTTAPVLELKKMGDVKRESFDSIRGVRINGVYYKVVDNVQVYMRSLNRYISLSEARANFESLSLYGDGNKVCFITVQ